VSLFPPNGRAEAGVVVGAGAGFPNIPLLKRPPVGDVLALGFVPIAGTVVPSAGFGGRSKSPPVGAPVVPKS
jgi:hypothetical protein